MKDKQMFETELNPSSLDFIVKLTSITVKRVKEGDYHLQLEKGLRHIKNIPQTITVLKNIHEYSFDTTEQIRLKLHSIKSSSFCWSLYKRSKEDEEYIDSIKMDLSEFYKIYTDEVKKHPRQFSNIVHKKSHHKQLGTSWRNMKIMLKNCYFFTKEACNDGNNIKIRYSLEIKHALDYLAEKQQVKCQLLAKKSMWSRKISVLRSSSLSSWRSRTISRSRRISFSQQNLSLKSSTHEHNISSLKQTESPSFYQPSRKQISNLQYPVYLDVEANHNSLNKDMKQITPQIGDLIMEHRTELSDIIENSHESSITLNLANFGDRTDRKRYAELILIQEQPLQKNSMRNTLVYNRPQQMDESIKRIHTLRDFTEQPDLTKNEKLQENHRSAQDPQSRIQNSRKQSLNLKEVNVGQKPKDQHQTIKSIFVVMIILIIFLVSTNAIKPTIHKINQNMKKNSSLARTKLNRGRQKSF